MKSKNRTAVLATVLAALAAVLAGPGLLQAQGPQQQPPKFKNLKVFPKDIPHDQLIDAMRGFSRSLGVRCEYCHATVKTASGRDSTDFASDSKKMKNKARFMLHMTHELNEDLRKVPEKATPAIAVSCVTCHRGSPLPRTVDMVVAAAIDSSGVETGIARYRALRDMGMERGRFDFSEGPIIDLADRYAKSGKTSEALELLKMDAEFHPQAASIDVETGDIYRAMGKTDDAIAAYKNALTKDPESMQAKRRLAEMTGGGGPPGR